MKELYKCNRGPVPTRPKTHIAMYGPGNNLPGQSRLGYFAIPDPDWGLRLCSNPEWSRVTRNRF